jgi:hypothetical protein
MGFFKWLNEQLSTEAAVGIHTVKFLDMPQWSKFSKEWKANIRANFDTRSQAILQAENPLFALREEIQMSALRFAECAVLCASGWKIPSRFSGCPYISNELEHHLDVCAQLNPELLEHCLHLSDSREGRSLWEAMLSAAWTTSLVEMFYVQGFNLMRVKDKDDVSRDADWFDPLILSCLIYTENDYRRKIGLPSLLDGASNHYWFAALVGRGIRDPLVQWERKRGPHPIRRYPHVN